ncbi:MAG: hypothetical protein EBZ13_12380 [Planctomycetia bacterium]|nr:hypothetical protein [Planctomycetia bacterium]
MPRFAVVLSVAVFLGSAGGVVCPAADLADVADQPLGEIPTFEKPSAGALTEAATTLRQALRPLDRLLSRSKSGADWRAYLDWSAAETQAAAGEALDLGDIRNSLRSLMWRHVGVERSEASLAEAAQTVAGWCR